MHLKSQPHGRAQGCALEVKDTRVFIMKELNFVVYFVSIDMVVLWCVFFFLFLNSFIVTALTHETVCLRLYAGCFYI